MAQDLDALLRAYGPADPTVVFCERLFRIAPIAEPPAPWTGLADLVASVPHAERGAVLERARDIARGDDAQAALRVLQGLDPGIEVVAILTSLKSAVKLYLAHRDLGRVEAELEDRQAEDAVIKTLGIALAAARLLGEPRAGAARRLADIPSGRALLAFHAAIDVAVPFLDDVREAGGKGLHRLVERQGASQARLMAAQLSWASVWEAAEVVPELLDVSAELASAAAAHAGPVVDLVTRDVAVLELAADAVSTAVAAGADALPVYRYLGARLVAECVVLRARGVLHAPVVPVAAPVSKEDVEDTTHRALARAARARMHNALPPSPPPSLPSPPSRAPEPRPLPEPSPAEPISPPARRRRRPLRLVAGMLLVGVLACGGATAALAAAGLLLAERQGLVDLPDLRREIERLRPRR
jgi:hypothetical protein